MEALRNVKARYSESSESLLQNIEHRDIINAICKKLAFVDLLRLSYTCKELKALCEAHKKNYLKYLKGKLAEHLIKESFYKSMQVCGITGSFLLYYLILNPEWETNHSLPNDIDVFYSDEYAYMVDPKGFDPKEGISMKKRDNKFVFKDKTFPGARTNVVVANYMDQPNLKPAIRSVVYLDNTSTLVMKDAIVALVEPPPHKTRFLAVNLVQLAEYPPEECSKEEVISKRIRTCFDLKFLMNTLIVDIDGKAKLTLEHVTSVLERHSHYYYYDVDHTVEKMKATGRIKKYRARGFTIEDEMKSKKDL